VFWVDNLVSRENPVLKPVAAIRASFEAAGVEPGSKVVVYCRTGVQAAHDYFTLKLLGFTPLLYDGSFIEWSNNAATKVERGK
jgi:thiosulfate/3-mercaptopyruvate sulfurtransferase